MDTQNLQLRLAPLCAQLPAWSKQYQCVLTIPAITRSSLSTLNRLKPTCFAGEAYEDEMKNYDGAIAQFRAAVKAAPKEPDVHFGLGYILWTQRRYPEAATEFQAELDNNPRHAQSLVYLGDADMQLDHPDLSPSLFEKALAIDPKLELAHLDLGILYGDQGRKDDALRELTTATKLAPNDVNAHWRLGRLYRLMGKKDEANAEFDKANNLHKATNDALFERMNGGHAARPRPDQPPASSATAN